MKILGLILSLLLSVQMLAQFSYYNSVYPNQDWIYNLSGNVAVTDDGYAYCGIYTQSSNLGYFVRKVTDEFESPELIVDIACNSLLTQRSEAFKSVTNGFLQVGHKDGAAWALRIDNDGNVIWEVTHNDNEAFGLEYNSGMETTIGDFIFVGNKGIDTDGAFGPEFGKLYVSKVNAAGETLWENDVFLTDDEYFEANGVFELSNGEILISGTLYNDFDKVIVKLSESGSLIDMYRWGSDEFGDWMPWLVQKENDEFIVAHLQGQSEYDDQYDNMTINVMKFDPTTMTPDWNVEFPELEPGVLIRDFIATPDGGYAILGVNRVESIQPGFILKLDEDYNEEWRKSYHYDLAVGGIQHIYDIDLTADGGFICSGYVAGLNSIENPSRAWVLKLDACGDMEDLGCEFIDNINEVQEQSFFSIYPNPTNGSFTLTSSLSLAAVQDAEITVRNTLGQIIYTELLSSHSTQIDIPELSSGIYLVSLRSDGRELFTQKLTVE